MSRLIKKAKSVLKSRGLGATVKAVLRHIKYVILSHTLLTKKKKREIVDGTVDASAFGSVIVFENNFGWTKIMKQRPQQIAENLPSDVLMFYHSSYDKDYDSKKRIKKLSGNLVLIDLGYYRAQLMDALKDHPDKYLMIYSTDYIELDRVKLYEDAGYRVIYEYVDDINRDLMGDEMYSLLSERHEKIMAQDGVRVICTAEELKKKVPCECALVTNGVDYAHFKRAEYEVPSDLLPIKERHRVLICYYGALASWFDYDLIRELAKERDYGIVLIGMDYDRTMGKSGVLDGENVYYLGKKPYAELPAYGCNCDILTIPFVINDITMATSPVKIFEYMAMERPIVTTDLPECRKYKSVLISKTHEEFIENVKRASTLEGDGEYVETERHEAMENDWKSKASAIMEFAKR